MSTYERNAHELELIKKVKPNASFFQNGHLWKYVGLDGPVSFNPGKMLFFPANDKRYSNDADESDYLFDSSECVSLRMPLCYFRHESVAMWKLYAPNGVCVRYTPSFVFNLRNHIDDYHLWIKGRVNPVHLDASSVSFVPKYVIYRSSSPGEGYRVFRGSHKAAVTVDEYRDITGRFPTKSSCWAYETEIRIYALIRVNTLTAKHVPLDAINRLEASFEPAGKDIIVVSSPFIGASIEGRYDKSSVAIRESELKGIVRIEINK